MHGVLMSARRRRVPASGLAVVFYGEGERVSRTLSDVARLFACSLIAPSGSAAHARTASYGIGRLISFKVGRGGRNGVREERTTRPGIKGEVNGAQKRLEPSDDAGDQRDQEGRP